MQIFNLIKKYLNKYKFRLILYLLISLILSALGIAAPYISGTFIDNLIRYPSAEIIYKFTVIYIFIAMFQLVFSYAITMLTVNIQTKMVFDFNNDIIRKIQKLSLLFLDSQNLVYLNQRVKTDCSTLILFSISFLNGVIVNTLSFITCIVVIMSINLQISLLIVFLVIAYCILYKLMKKPLAAIKFKLKEADAMYVSALQEQFNKIRIMKIFNLFNLFNDRLYKTFNALLFTNIKSAKYGFAFQSSDTVITMISQITLFLIGGFQIINGNLTIGLFTVLSSYFSNLINSTKFFINLGNQYIDSRVSADRLIQIMRLEEEPNGKMVLKCINNIKVDNLTFSYGSNVIIRNFNYVFEKNNIYKISGVNGKGKTTLINLLIGLYPSCYSGKILYNGIDIYNLDIILTRMEHICYIGQETQIFNGSVRENILLNKSDMTDKDLKRYVEDFKFDLYGRVGLDDFLNSEINENTTNFSGGELKKISIIRGLVSTGSLLIFDEPSNSLDNDSKLLLKKYLLEKKNNHIIILISHDNCYDDILNKKIAL